MIAFYSSTQDVPGQLIFIAGYIQYVQNSTTLSCPDMTTPYCAPKAEAQPSAHKVNLDKLRKLHDRRSKRKR